MTSFLAHQKRAVAIRMRGFTLLESLVAVAIITLAIAGPFLAAARAYFAALDANNRFMASAIAQEGLEYVRMLRDDTYLADFQAGKNNLSATAFEDDFENGVSGAASSVYGCEGNPYNPVTGVGTEGGDGSVACALDQTKPIGIGADHALQVCAGVNSCPALHVVNGQYVLGGGGTTSIFTRSIRFYNWGSTLKIVSTVSWTYHGVSSSVSLTEYLSPWE